MTLVQYCWNVHYPGNHMLRWVQPKLIFLYIPNSRYCLCVPRRIFGDQRDARLFKKQRLHHDWFFQCKGQLVKRLYACADILTTVKIEIIPFLLRHRRPYAPLCECRRMQKFSFKAQELAKRPIRLFVRIYNDEISCTFRDRDTPLREKIDPQISENSQKTQYLKNGWCAPTWDGRRHVEKSKHK